VVERGWGQESTHGTGQTLLSLAPSVAGAGRPPTGPWGTRARTGPLGRAQGHWGGTRASACESLHAGRKRGTRPAA